ncbi:MAG: hypothetical protein ACLGIJ_13710 [Candidatus Limnocylindria bacterium]
MERLTAPARMFATTSLAVVAFGVAMGFLEAAVVVYLRAALEIVPSAVPAHDPATLGTFETIEVAREVATIVMIAVIGWLAGSRPLERLAWAAVAFGTWDIVYYAGLRLTIGWPPDLLAWDVLFLIPSPWVGPVWAPIIVSTALVGFGLAAARRLRMERPIAVGPIRALVAIGGGILVVAGFLMDAERVLAGDLSTWAGWPLFAAGMALAVAASVSAFGAIPLARSSRGGSARSGSGRRPTVGSPE